jgi:hypothetical protein
MSKYFCSCGNPKSKRNVKLCRSCFKKTISGNGNPMWKGNSVGYNALHDWIKSKLPKTQLCQHCNQNPPYDIANKSGQYKRDLSDWEWLCRKCHMESDGRMEKLKEIVNERKLTDDEKKEKIRLYRLKNKEYFTRKNHEHYIENREQILQYSKLRYQKLKGGIK